MIRSIEGNCKVLSLATYRRRREIERLNEFIREHIEPMARRYSSRRRHLKLIAGGLR